MKITFSEPITHVTGDGAGARPEIHWSAGDSRTGRFDVAASILSLASGDCAPRAAPPTASYLCHYTVRGDDTGAFKFSVGTGTTDRLGIALASRYEHGVTLTLTPAPVFGASVSNYAFTQGRKVDVTLPAAVYTGAVTYTVTPSLPTGLTFTAATRTISGTPTEASAASEYTYTATGGGNSDTRTFKIAVNAVVGSVQLIELVTADLPFAIREGGRFARAVWLGKQPVPNETITLTVTSDQPTKVRVDTEFRDNPSYHAAKKPDRPGLQNTLTFTSADWAVPQYVLLIASHDPDTEDESVNVTFTADSSVDTSDYEDATRVLPVNVDDHNTAVTITSVAALSLHEDSDSVTNAGTFTVALGAQPAYDTTVTIVAREYAAEWPDSDAVTLSPASLPFTTQNWATPQTVTVTAVQDGDATDESVVLLVFSSYQMPGRQAHGHVTRVAVTVADDETQPVQNSPPISSGGVAQLVGKTLTLRHDAGSTTGCLDVDGGAAENGRNVQTSACNDTKPQEWRLEQRPGGDHAGRYRLVSGVGDGSTYCLDNRGDFSDSERMGIWECVADTHGAVANQTFDLTSSGQGGGLMPADDGWVLTFVRGSASSMLWAERSANSASGNVGQRTGAASSRAVWQLTDPDAAPPQPVLLAAQSLTPTQAPPPTLSFTGQAVTLSHVAGGTTGCLDVDGGAAENGRNVQTWECNDTKAQVWQVEQRPGGDHAGRYRLVSDVGDGSTYCLDNRGDFSNSDRMGIWECVADTHGAAANQSFDLTASGDGWVLTFVQGDASSMLWAERSSTNVRGNVGQRTGEASGAAVWRIAAVQPPALSVADAAVTEAAGAQLAFTVSLDRAVLARDGTVSVSYATRDVTATAGADYTAASGTLTFAVGARTNTVHVTVLEDAHDDGGETLELVLSNAVGATIADGTGTGTIDNADPLPKAWLARFGRTAADQVLDGVRGRLEAARAPGGGVVVAGHALQRSGELTADGGLAALAKPPAFAAGTAQSVPAAQEVLVNSSFTATGPKDESGGSLALWGRAAQSTFTGRDESQDQGVDLSGDVTTTMVGVDYGGADWLAGALVSLTGAAGGYAGGAGSGQVETLLPAATLYGGVAPLRWLDLWGAGGYGLGSLTLTPAAEAPARSGLTWMLVAAGARGTLASPGAAGGPLMAVTSDGLWVRTDADDQANTTAEVMRARLGLDGGWSLRFDGGAFTPKVEIGVRYDEGDAETGFGVEIGGGVRGHHGVSGLSLELSGRTLLWHEVGHEKEWGLAAGLTYDPNPTSERGPSLTLRHQAGLGAAAGGLDALFAPGPIAHPAGRSARGGWTAEAAWGFPAGAEFTAGPIGGIRVAATERTYSVGWRLAPEGANAPNAAVAVKATRHESADRDPVHDLSIGVEARW